LPIIRINSEAVAISKETLRALPAALYKELGEGLSLRYRSTTEESPVLGLDSQIKLSLGAGHDYV
jgi:hypothetical protein